MIPLVGQTLLFSYGEALRRNGRSCTSRAALHVQLQLEQLQSMLLSSLFPARAGWAEVVALGHMNVSLVAVLRLGGKAEGGVCPRFLMENKCFP